MKKKLYKDLPWNKGCDPEIWYRELGPLVYDGQSRHLSLVRKLKFGVGKGEYVERIVWGWWR